MTVTEISAELQDYRDGYSDLHKDVYGFRPRHDMRHLDVEQWKLVYSRLYRQLDENNEAEAVAEAAAIIAFETRVEKVIAMGAADRAAAIRWIADAENADGDLSYLAYLLGLPYRYLPVQ